VKNGKRLKRVICVLTAVCTAAVFAGCTTFDSFKHAYVDKAKEDSSPVITIGVIEPQTGSNSDRGKQEIKGIELANSIYNNVDGYKVELRTIDTQSKVSTAKTAVQSLVDMKPAAIIGCAGEATSLAISDAIEENHIPTITPSATNPLITQSNKYYFRACITESQMGEGLAEYAYRKLKSDRIGMISLKNDNSTAALIDGFNRNIKKLAGKKNKAVRSTSEIMINDEEINNALDSIQREECDVCFVSLGKEAMDVFFTKAEEKGLTGITYLGTRSWGDNAFVEMMKKHPDIKVVFPYASVMAENQKTLNKLTEEAQRFQIEYASRYGSDDIPTDNAALAYDSYLLLINAIHNAKSTEGKDIRKALLELKEMRCATGVFTFDESGNVVRTVNLSTINSDYQVVSEYITGSEAEAKQLEEVEKAQETEGK